MRGDVEGLRPELLSTLRMYEYLLQKELGGSYELQVNSGVRDDAGHAEGWAADVQIPWRGGWYRRKMVEKAFVLDVPRIGVYDGHIEISIDPTRVDDVLWVGTSEPLENHGTKTEDVAAELAQGFQEGCE